LTFKPLSGNRSAMNIAQEKTLAPPSPGFIRLFLDGTLLKSIDPSSRIRTYQSTLDRQYIEPYAGEPANAVAATITIDPTGADNSILYTADTKGAAGNGISVQYAISGSGSTVLSVAVTGNAILVTAGSACVASAVITAVNADATAAALVTASASGTVTGVIAAVAVTNLTGGIDGTPAKLGRLATDGTDVWTALVENETVTQSAWVKTFNG
jgi:hypothetical protein